jgi:hypothetical protein
MERGDLSKGSRKSEVVDGPLTMQRRRVEDRAFTESGRVLNTGGLSAGGLLRIAATARAGPSEPVVKEAEERALVDAVAMDVEERAASSSSRTPIAMAFICILPLVFSFFVLLSYRNGVFSLEATTELERLRAAVDAFLDFMGVAPGAREEHL